MQAALSLAPSHQLAAVGIGGRAPARRQPGASAPNRALAAARMAAGLFIGATIIYGVAVGGYAGRLAGNIQDQARAAMVHAGFTVQQLAIEGLNQTSREDIVKTLGFGEGTPIFNVDSITSKQRLEKLSWVREAKVMRFLPSTVHVVVEERIPFAVWQIDGKMRLIDVAGRVITPVAREDYPNLPLVVGKGGPTKVRELFALLNAHAELKSRVLAVVRVAERRWTLKLQNGVEIKLPEERIASALDRLAELEQARGVLSADIKSIDFRLGDRISMRLTDEAVARRENARKEAARQTAQPTGRGT